MSLKDELGRAYKKKREASERFANDVEKTRKILNGLLESKFSILSLQMRSRNQNYIDTLQSLKVIDHLKELRNECKLLYKTEQKSEYREGIFGNSYYVNSRRDIPAKLTLSLHNAKIRSKHGSDINYREIGLPHALLSVVYNNTIIECPNSIDLDKVTNLHSTLADYKTWTSYQNWAEGIKANWDYRSDFSEIIDAFEKSLNELEIPPLERIYIRLIWDYEYHSGHNDYESDWETCDEISVETTSEIITIRRGENNSSISLDKCTSKWVMENIVNLYV